MDKEERIANNHMVSINLTTKEVKRGNEKCICYSKECNPKCIECK